MGNTLAKQARQAAATNDVPRLTAIVSSLGGQNALMKCSFWNARTALHCAARGGCAEALAAVIEVAAHRTRESGGETLTGFLNAPDRTGDTALALACKHGHADCLRELLEAGASPLPANTHGFTALHYAAIRGHVTCLRLLLSSYVRLPDGSHGRTVDALVQDVIDTERFLDTRTHNGLCALHLAVLSGSQPAVNDLVTAGAQLDTPLLSVGMQAPLLMPSCLATGSTALHMAAATGRASLVTTLLHAQQERHPGLELRRMRNARGMTPLNVALLCGFSNMASLLAAGAPVPAPTYASRSRQLPPLLRQQLLTLVHRAALLAQLRELGMGSCAAAQAPRLPAAAVSRLESLLNSETAAPSQVLAAVDELLEDGAAASGDASGGSAGAAPPAAGGGGRGSRRRQRRQQEEQARVQRQLASVQAGADWTLLERNRTLWHAEHSSSLYRRLHHQQDRHASLLPMLHSAPQAGEAAAAVAAAAAAAPSVAAGGILMLAGALLTEDQAGEQQQQGPSSSRQHSGSSQGADSKSSSDGDGTPHKLVAAAALTMAAAALTMAAARAGSEGEAAVCPVCLDLLANISLAPCGHQACIGCCGRLASYSPTGSSFGLPLQSPLCPLCRAPIEAFRSTVPS